MLERQHDDIVFCDWQMPNMGGEALFEWIRRRQPDLLSAFAFVTGGVLNPEFQSRIESRHSPLLSKPYNAAARDALLERVLPERLKDEHVPA